jgi:hypothetical protein
MANAAFVSMILLACTSVASCGSSGGSPCSQNGRCPGDKARSQSMVDDCNVLLGDGQCGHAYQTALACLSENEQCDPAGNVDTVATQQACSSQIGAWTACSSATDGGTVK